jgi:hypothetical protein
MTLVSPYLTFPPISWWAMALQADSLILDGCEHFQKMSYRNRYRISGANNPILLSVPLASGREQSLPMRDVLIYNKERWQIQHWRTIISVYRRSPYFDYYEHSLSPLFQKTYSHLVSFNLDAIEWIRKQLKMSFTITESGEYIKEYPAGITDLRNTKKLTLNFPQYYQVFENRIGFQPDLSVLDLLFSEGPAAVQLLMEAAGK